MTTDVIKYSEEYEAFNTYYIPLNEMRRLTRLAQSD